MGAKMQYELINNGKKSFNPIEQVLLNRGIKKEDIVQFLNPDDNNILDPLLLNNMARGAKMLLLHIQNADRIHFVVDADCDGFCSSAALINYLNYLFPSCVQNYVTYSLHDGKQHGIILKDIPDDVKLVITPDSSSNEEDLHKTLFDRGIDVLVLD